MMIVIGKMIVRVFMAVVILIVLLNVRVSVDYNGKETRDNLIQKAVKIVKLVKPLM